MNNEDFIAEQARSVLEQNRVAVFVVAYNAEQHIQQVGRLRLDDQTFSCSASASASESVHHNA